MGKQIRYTQEFKMQTVQMYLQGDLSANQLALSLGIHPHSVRHWIQDYNDGKLRIAEPLDYRRPDLSDVVSNRQPKPSNQPDIGIIISKISTLESEIKDLKTILQAYLLSR